MSDADFFHLAPLMDRVEAMIADGDHDALRQVLTRRDLPWLARRTALAHLVEEAVDDIDYLLLDELGHSPDRFRAFCARALWRRDRHAVPPLFQAIDDRSRRPWIAAVLACTWAGRDMLRTRADVGSFPLRQALQTPAIPLDMLVHASTALAICPDAAAGNLLAGLIHHPHLALADAAGWALLARYDSAAVPWMTKRIRQVAGALNEYLGWIQALDDPAALPVLGALYDKVAPPLSHALRQTETRLKQLVVPVTALSRADTPGPRPTRLALSLWRDSCPAADEAEDV